MKYYKKIVLLLVASVMLFTVSCDDELEQQPFGALTTDSFFTSVTDFRLAVDGMYAQLLAGGYYGGTPLTGLPDLLSDNVTLSSEGRLSNRNNFEFNYNSQNNIGPLNEAYEIINLANIIIERIDNLPAGDDRNDILGQALAARALCHFDMVRLYGQIPTQDPGANGTLGVPYIRFEDGDTGDPFAQPSRDTVGQNYQDIVADLNQAVGLIAANNGDGRFNTDAVNALLSRVYLYMGEWQNAIDASNAVTAGLASITDLPAVFSGTRDGRAGVLLSAPQDPALDGITIGVVWSQVGGGNIIPEYVVDFDFLNLISTDDIRRDIISIDGTTSAGTAINAINKVGVFVNGVVDLSLIRVAEAFLNRAEAQFNLGQEGAALTTLDALRAVRYTANAPSGETGQALEDAIQFERRVELAFEHHRFFDIKRRGESIMRNPSNGDLADGTGTPPAVPTLAAGDFRFQIPIPIAETQNNPNFMQNPGY